MLGCCYSCSVRDRFFWGGSSRGPTGEGNDWNRLPRLLQTAFAQLAQAAPTLWVSDPTGSATMAPSEGSRFANPFERLPFPRSVPARGQAEDVADAFLIVKPTFVVPSWEREKGSRLSEYEKLLLDCRPGGPEALMAILVPAAFLASRQSERTREGVARFWRPILIMYSNDPILGIHPSLEYAALFLSPRADSARPLTLFRIPPQIDFTEIEQDLTGLLAGKPERHRFGYCNVPQMRYTNLRRSLRVGGAGRPQIQGLARALS